MVVNFPLRRSGIAEHQGIKNPLMLGAYLFLPLRGPEQGGDAHQDLPDVELAVSTGDQLVTGGIYQLLMKQGVQTDKLTGIPRDGAALEGSLQIERILHLISGHRMVCNDQSGGVPLQDPPQLHELGNLTARHRRHIGSPLRDQLHEPVGYQQQQCFADRRPGHADIHGQFLFVEELSLHLRIDENVFPQIRISLFPAGRTPRRISHTTCIPRELRDNMRVAIAQIISTGDPAANLDLLRSYSADAKEAGARIVVFPEAAMCAFGNPLDEIAEPLDGEWATSVRGIAAELEIVIVAGMFTPGTGGRVRNTLLVSGPGVETSYNKIHLFDAFGYAESDSVEAGTSPVTFDVDGTRFGLATCYDVRFPALFTAHARAGADINIVCASWGAGEGKADQWDLLTRARAVDSTAFVVACGQGDPDSIGLPSAGTAPTGIGRSAVVSPLGSPMLVLDSKPELAVVDIDTSVLAGVRQNLPVLANARSF